MLGTVCRAGDLLDLFDLQNSEWGATAVSRQLRITKSQAHEMLVSLETIGLLRRSGRGRFRLGWKMVTISQRLIRSELSPESAQMLRRLATHAGTSVDLIAHDGKASVRIGGYGAPTYSRGNPRVTGHLSATGTVLLAAMEPERGEALLADLDVISGELADELVVVREREVAFEVDEGRRAVAAPVYDPDGYAFAALGLAVSPQEWSARGRLLTTAIQGAPSASPRSPAVGPPTLSSAESRPWPPPPLEAGRLARGGRVRRSSGIYERPGTPASRSPRVTSMATVRSRRGGESAASRLTSVADALSALRRSLPPAVARQVERRRVEATHDANIRALAEVQSRPRHGVAPAPRSQATEALGHRLRSPLVAASIGALGLAHPDGEPGVARAFGDAGAIVFVSGATSTAIEEIVAAASGPVYFQPYFSGSGREGMAIAIERAKAAGAAGLVFCIDSVAGHTPARSWPGRRHRLPTSLSLAEAIRFLPQAVRYPGWTLDFLSRRSGLELPMMLDAEGRPVPFEIAQKAVYEHWVAWEDLEWIRDVWNCPVVVKGVLSSDEARRAVAAGAAAVVVSNHGGNRLDGTMPALPVLPEVVAAVGDEVDVIFDSGIRTGPDVVKALALGARAVGLGRAYLYPLAADGEAGVRRILEIFRQDIDRTLAYLACTSLDQLSPDRLTRMP